MIVNYQLAGAPRHIDIADSDHLTDMCRDAEESLRRLHPELANAPYLSERIADGMLNGLAGEHADIDLGPLP
jgi:hypothetical protein